MSHEAAVRVSAKNVVLPVGFAGAGSTSNLTHVAVSRTQCPEGHWTEGLSSSVALDQKLSSVPCHVALSIGQLTTWKLASFNANKQEVEGHTRRKPQSFCNLISQVTSHPSATFYSLEMTKSRPQPR